MGNVRELVYATLKVNNLIDYIARRFTTFRNGKVNGETCTKQIQTTYGNILITTTKRQMLCQEQASAEQNMTQFTATVKAILDPQQFQTNLTVSFQQHSMADGFVSLCPSISVGRTWPDDAPIFELVETGDINGFLSLLTRGEASLRDRNSQGIPLLFVSGTICLNGLCYAYSCSMRWNNLKCANC